MVSSDRERDGGPQLVDDRCELRLPSGVADMCDARLEVAEYGLHFQRAAPSLRVAAQAGEISNWEFIMNSTDVQELRDHLKRFPGGRSGWDSPKLLALVRLQPDLNQPMMA